MNGTTVTITQYGTGYAVEVAQPGEPPYLQPFIHRAVYTSLRDAIYGFMYRFTDSDFELVSRWEMKKLRDAVPQTPPRE